MSSDNPIQEPIQETESTQESQKPESPLLEDSQESEKSEDSADNEKAAEEEGSALTPPRKNNVTGGEDGGGSGRERLKRHRVEVAGRVWIPDMWGQEDLLKDWIDCTSFDASLARATILMARDSLAKDARSPTHSTQLRVQDG